MIYLDHAATSYPKPAIVGRTMLRTMRDAGGNPGRSGHMLSMRAAQTVFQTREDAASFFGSDAPENVLFYPNATYALNTVLHSFGRGVDGERRRHILISELEHNAVLRPLYHMQRKGEIEWDVYPVFSRDKDGCIGMLSDEEILDGIRRRITSDTVLVCACHVSNVCAARLPLRRIGTLCRSAGCAFLADASQSAGIYDIDMEKDHIDYLCTAGHKALLGPQGSGLLLVGKQAKLPVSLVQGGNGVASLSPEMPTDLPERMEAGTLSTPCIAGLGAGIRFVSDIGLETIRANAYALYQRLREILLSLRGVTLYQSQLTEGTTLSFSVNQKSCEEVAQRLSNEGICVRAGFHCAPMPHRAFGTEKEGTVRISIGWGNTLRDADAFYHVLRQIVFDESCAVFGKFTGAPCADGKKD